jgi:hypothetical protein
MGSFVSSCMHGAQGVSWDVMYASIKVMHMMTRGHRSRHEKRTCSCHVCALFEAVNSKLCSALSSFPSGKLPLRNAHSMHSCIALFARLPQAHVPFNDTLWFPQSLHRSTSPTVQSTPNLTTCCCFLKADVRCPDVVTQTSVVNTYGPQTDEYVQMMWSFKFDMVFLTLRSGMYYGPASDAVAYFCGLGYQCPSLYNPAGITYALVPTPTCTHMHSFPPAPSLPPSQHTYGRLQ